MKNLNIVLYSPEIPQNTGNISRTCAVTGAALHIIRPIGFEISDRTLKRAGLDYWDKLEVTYYDSYGDFVAKNQDAALYYFSAKGKRCYTEIKYPERVFLVFGRESVGLPEDLIRDNIESTVRIPMLANVRCLNLSNAVAVAAYEVLRQGNFSEFQLVGSLG
ncbi:MAG: tRNA (cytidine(34)-2'-O)-methyltransferase [Clostridia bacterium]|nr:tRNA (cytidine(34)-2'-O)-methyltransferase [Clostridia bacterium]